MSETKPEEYMRLDCLRQAVISTNAVFNVELKGHDYGKDPVEVAKKMYAFVSGKAA